MCVLLATWIRLLADILIGEYIYFLVREISIETISSYFEHSHSLLGQTTWNWVDSNSFLLSVGLKILTSCKILVRFIFVLDRRFPIYF